jgi:hypothetical protein
MVGHDYTYDACKMKIQVIVDKNPGPSLVGYRGGVIRVFLPKTI